jgi:hypothetical protein
MTRLKVILVALVSVPMAASVAGAGGGPGEGVVSVRKAGPIIRGETTFSEVKSWFGEPDDKRRHDYQCIRVINARWHGDLNVLFDTFDNTMVIAKIKDPSIVSQKHGEIDFETRKGLRVGDRARKVHNLYPNAELHEHRNYNHHILRRGDRGRLEATTQDSRVTELRTFPYEAC